MRTLTCAIGCGLLALTALDVRADGPHYTVRFLNRSQYPQSVRCLAFSPDGSVLAVSTSYGDVKFIRVQDGETVGKFDFTPFSIAFSSDGHHILMISESGRKLVDGRSMQAVDIDVRQEPGFVGIEFEQKNGKWLIKRLTPNGAAERSGDIQVGDEIVGIGEGESRARIRDARGVRTDRLLELLAGPAGSVVRLHVIHHGELVPQTIELQRLARRNVNGKTTYVVPEKRTVTDTLAWCMFNGLHQFSNAANGRVVAELRTTEVNNRGLHALSADSRRFAVVGDTEDGLGVEVFDVASRGQLLCKELPIWETPSIQGTLCFDVAFTADGKQLVIGAWDTAEIVDVSTGDIKRSIALDGGERRKRPAAGATGITAIVDRSEFKNDGDIRGRRVVEKLAVSSRGILATGNPFGEVKLWDLASGQFLKSMPVMKGEEETIEKMAFSSDGKWLAYFVEGTLHLVNVADVRAAAP